MSPLGQLAALLGGFWAAGRVLGYAMPTPRRNPRRREGRRSRSNPTGHPFSGGVYRPAIRGKDGKIRRPRVHLEQKQRGALSWCDRVGKAATSRIPTRAAYVKALIAENPELETLIENEGGRKREITRDAGYFDGINQALDLKGRRKVKTWGQALGAVAPEIHAGQRLWSQDNRAHLLALQDVVNRAGGDFKIQPPRKAIDADELARVDADFCRAPQTYAARARARAARRPKGYRGPRRRKAAARQYAAAPF